MVMPFGRTHSLTLLLRRRHIQGWGRRIRRRRVQVYSVIVRWWRESILLPPPIGKISSRDGNVLIIRGMNVLFSSFSLS
uniref:Uncharacterized protein n=1 Tax=Lepeophtheirus salmonis TaxID=72036 RepID=A0A0K2T700_LEPSM